MAINKEQIAEKIFHLLTGFGFDIESYTMEGKLSIDPSTATRFVVEDPNILVRLDLEKDTIVLKTSEDLAEHDIREQLKNLTHDYLLTFDYEVYGKKIKAKGEQSDIANKSENNMAGMMEGFGTMSGSSKTSYQPLDNIKIVVRHKKAVDEDIRGSRSRNIHSIFVQRGEERFKLPENNLAMARAMARHLQKGGETFDEVGTKMVEMASDYKSLGQFVNYVRKSSLVNEDNQVYVDLAVENVQNIKNTFKRLAGAKTYETAILGLTETDEVIELDEDGSDIETLFTETHFDDKVANVMNNLKTLSVKRKAFESYLTKAIAKESFADLKNLLSESDIMDFATPGAKLGYQVSQLGFASKDQKLGNYLQGLSRKLNSGGNLSQFEYGTVKSCLLGAKNNSMQADAGVQTAEAQYESFMNQFVE